MKKFFTLRQRSIKFIIFSFFFYYRWYRCIFNHENSLIWITDEPVPIRVLLMGMKASINQISPWLILDLPIVICLFISLTLQNQSGQNDQFIIFYENFIYLWQCVFRSLEWFLIKYIDRSFFYSSVVLLTFSCILHFNFNFSATNIIFRF